MEKRSGGRKSRFKMKILPFITVTVCTAIALSVVASSHEDMPAETNNNYSNFQTMCIVFDKRDNTTSKMTMPSGRSCTAWVHGFKFDDDFSAAMNALVSALLSGAVMSTAAKSFACGVTWTLLSCFDSRDRTAAIFSTRRHHRHVCYSTSNHRRNNRQAAAQKRRHQWVDAAVLGPCENVIFNTLTESRAATAVRVAVRAVAPFARSAVSQSLLPSDTQQQHHSNRRQTTTVFWSRHARTLFSSAENMTFEFLSKERALAVSSGIEIFIASARRSGADDRQRNYFSSTISTFTNLAMTVTSFYANFVLGLWVPSSTFGVVAGAMIVGVGTGVMKRAVHTALAAAQNYANQRTTVAPTKRQLNAAERTGPCFLSVPVQLKTFISFNRSALPNFHRNAKSRMKCRTHFRTLAIR